VTVVKHNGFQQLTLDLYVPTRGPAERPSVPDTTEPRPKAAGNRWMSYSAKTKGKGTWMKLLVNPRKPISIAIIKKSSKETKTEIKESTFYFRNSLYAIEIKAT
jgi:hypothetical protein